MPARHRAERRVRLRAWVALALGAAVPLMALGQRARDPEFADAPLPPRLGEAREPADAASRSQVPANRARLAPLQEERIEEIVVSGEGSWRVPDLGSDWRALTEAERERRRYRFAFLPPLDASAAPPIQDNLFLVNRGVERPGTVQIFRWRPGRRDGDNAEVRVDDERSRRGAEEPSRRGADDDRDSNGDDAER